MSEKMTLDQWLAKIEAGHPTEIELGLSRVAEVATLLAIDLCASTVITVAGTNGKGSTTCMLDAILCSAGFSTGVYTSPHFLRYNERIQVNGQDASDSSICDAFEAIERVRGSISLTYFEYGTLAAFYIFQQAKLDYLLLEVGLGGRLDAVNIIDADIAVITSLALDHIDWLGDNLEAIGREKAGIFRAKRPAVCGVRKPPASVRSYATELDVPLYISGREFSAVIRDEDWDWCGVDGTGRRVEYFELPLPSLPLVNAATVLQVISLLDAQIDSKQIVQGLSQARMTGRMQQEHLGPAEMILDVAHNPEAAAYLSERLQSRPIEGETYLILGMLVDKDRLSVMRNLAPLVDHWLLCSLTGSRASSASELAALVDTNVKADQYGSVAEALNQLESLVTAKDRVLVCGSFLTVTEALVWLKMNQ